MKMDNKTARLAVAAVLLASAAGSPAQAADQEWEFAIGTYLWATSIDGDGVVNGQPVKVDASFSDLLDVFEIGGGLVMRGERNHWVFWTQADYFQISTDELDDPPEHGDLDIDTTMVTVGFGREFESSNGRRSLDVLLGARYLKMDAELQFDTIGTFKSDNSHTDPLIILRPSFQISERWRLNPTFSYGTGGDSESTYELQPQVEFQVNERWAMRFGYRKLYYDIENSNGNAFDGSFAGPIIGFAGTFGGGPEPVAAPPPPPPVAKAAPPPPPPPPPPPGDADKDGVTDDKDRCPTTPAGVVVDSIGCFKEITLRGVLFEFDSEALTAETRGMLDGLVAELRTRPADIVAGTKVTIEGHTDSVGSDAYNQGLALRRAESVRQYFVDKGLSASMVVATGAGETSPVDSNDTAEGRANNRRVVIKATR